MKKAWICLAVCIVVSLALCLAVSWPREEHGGPITLPTLRPGPSGTNAGNTDPEEPGEVRLYFGQEPLDERHTQLVQQYLEQTGNKLVLVQDAEEATVFAVTSPEELTQWQDQLYDLTGTPVLGELYNPNFALMVDGKPVGLAMDVTGYGIIYNAALLAKAGFTRTDITDFTYLKNTVEFISAEHNKLSFVPFCTANFDGIEFARLLAGIGENPDAVRAFLDLYLENETVAGDPKEQFVEGNMVFYVGGAWEYADISGMGIHNLDILPIYTPDGGSLHCICKNYWCVNSQAKPQDLQASLDFLEWMVTAGEITSAPVDSLGYFAPFADAAAAENEFFRLLRRYIATEPVVVRWEVAPSVTDAQLEALSAALAAYTALPNDETWAAVATLLNP